MRILNGDSDKSLDDVYVFLTIEEAREMHGFLGCLIKDYEQGDLSAHAHVNDKEYMHEVTISLYFEEDLKGYSKRVVTLIKEDK